MTRKERKGGCPRRRALRAGAVLAVASAGAAARAQCAPAWSFPGGNTNIDGVVYGLAAAWGNPGSAWPAHLIVGGASDVAGTVLYKKVAIYDGWAWRIPGGGLSLAVEALDVAAPSGASPHLTFYAAGEFGQAGNVPVNNIALWSGGTWTSPGGGFPTGFVTALFWCQGPVPLGPALYAGGPFGEIGEPTRGLARWDGVSWSALGGGIWNTSPLSTPKAKAFALYDDDGPGPRPIALYIGGPFDYAGGTLVNHVARWDGAAWEPVGGGAGSDIRCMAVFDPDGAGPEFESLFVGGGYNYAGGVYVNNLGRWDGTAWHAVPGWTGAAPRDMTVFDDDGLGPNKPALFIAGIGGYVLKWDGQQWESVGGGTTGAPFGFPEVFTLQVFDEDGDGPNPGGLYAGGWFNYAGGIPSPRIARWGCPLPARCDANCTRDFHPVTGQPILTVADFACFQTRYVLKDPYADCNEDAELTVQDFGCFQTRFVTGCP